MKKTCSECPNEFDTGPNTKHKMTCSTLCSKERNRKMNAVSFIKKNPRKKKTSEPKFNDDKSAPVEDLISGLNEIIEIDEDGNAKYVKKYKLKRIREVREQRIKDALQSELMIIEFFSKGGKVINIDKKITPESLNGQTGLKMSHIGAA